MDYSSVCTAGNWIFLDGLYSGSQMAYSPDAGESWKSSSYMGTGKRDFTLATDAADTVLFATSSNWIIASHDMGTTWAESDSGIDQPTVAALAFSRGAGSPSNGILMAAGMSAGMFVSTDVGAHWLPANGGFTSLMATSVIAVDSVFLAGTADRGIFRSTDNGTTWSPAVTGLPDTSIAAMATVSGQAFAAAGTNVYRSTDSGSTWALIPQQPPAVVLNLALIPTPGRGDGVAVFAITDSGSFRMASDDSTWTRVSSPSNTYYPAVALAGCDTVLYSITMYMVRRSSDLGNTWFPVGANGAGGHFITGHASSKYEHSRLYSGLFVSTNRGSKWEGMRPLPDLPNVTALSVSQDTSLLGYDQLTIGTDSGKVEFSGDGGKTWNVLREPDEASRGYQVFDVAEMDGIVFTSLQPSLYFHYAGDSIAGVYRTTDAGSSWEKMNTTGLADTLVLSLDVFRGKSGERVLFAGGWWNLFRSTDDGATWTEDTLAPIRSGRKFLREVDGTLFLCTQGTIQREYLPDGSVVDTYDSSGVFRSTDDGVTWKDVTGNLRERFIRGFAAAVVPEYPSRVFLAASADGDYALPSKPILYTSTEGGRQWEDFDDGLRWVDWGAEVGADEKYVYVGLGLLRRPWQDAVITSVEPGPADHPTGFSLSQNYPNPFNPSTEIRYEIPTAVGRGSGLSSVRLVVYDLLGREVATLVNEPQKAGTHTVEWNAGRNASGVYFYTLAVDGFVQTRKMVLTK